MAGRQLLDADSRAISLASFFCPPGKLGIGIYFGGTPDEKLAVAQIYATLSIAQELTTDETTTPRQQLGRGVVDAGQTASHADGLAAGYRPGTLPGSDERSP